MSDFPRQNTALQALQQHVPGDLAGLLVNSLGQFVPGYNFVITLIRQKLGVDADKVLAVLGFFFGGWAFFKYVKNTVLPKILQSFTSVLVIDDDDKVYDDLNRWLQKRRVFDFSQNIKLADNKAYTDDIHSRRHSLRYITRDHDNNSHTQNDNWSDYSDDGQDEDGDKIFNTKAAYARKPLQFEPCTGTRWFFHRGRPFFISRTDPTQLMRNTVRALDGVRDQLNLYTIGFSTEPLRALIEEIRADRHLDRIALTNVFRNDQGRWQKLSSKLSRQMHTIVLSKEQKELIVKDANDFLRPAGARWYAAHGIPYRRGYLFSGPPGTGKSSVSYALAGLLGLDIYIMPLAGAAIHDFQIETLFNTVPSRALILLEDVDCAGILREPDHGMDNINTHNSRHHEGVTLSGLLNAVDGVAASEGRILIMTTNKPEALDEALIRPGRVDIHLRFPLASTTDCREIFMRMYSHEQRSARPATTLRSNRVVLTVQDVCRDATEMELDLNCPHMPVSELQELATRYAEQIPEATFSPAEILSHLLLHRTKPLDAAENAGRWAAEQVEIKKADVIKREEHAKQVAAAAAKRKAKRKEQRHQSSNYDSDATMSPGHAQPGQSGSLAFSGMPGHSTADKPISAPDREQIRAMLQKVQGMQALSARDIFPQAMD